VATNASKAVPLSETVEWLEADGLGGFASGTVVSRRTRRYHALLLAATTPPTGRYVLVNGFDAWVEMGSRRTPLSSQRYLPDVIDPDGQSRLRSFADEPWPRWQWVLEDGSKAELELFVPHGTAACVLLWRRSEGSPSSRLCLRPFLSGRDYHSLHHENAAFRFDAHIDGQVVTWHPYDSVPTVTAVSNGRYEHAPLWFRNFLYSVEQERGLDCAEDLASPGTFSWDTPEAVLILAADEKIAALFRPGTSATEIAQKLRESEQRRRAGFKTRLHCSADAYLVRRGSGKTIIAGYPWFTDWGRDTFIALRGLCIATGRLDEARDILAAWGETVSEGMLPNRFPDQGTLPEFNAVDASLWYVIAVDDYLTTAKAAGRRASAQERSRFAAVIQEILNGYRRGTRFGIHGDEDGLLACGEPGTQLTWMDARVNGRPVTPRVGKPVEVQALWLNALRIAACIDNGWRDRFVQGLASFRLRFWNAARGCLYDVVDVDHRKGIVDDALRPNQIFAIGGLPETLLEAAQARQVVDVVESRLWTPIGLRTLEPGAPGYRPRCTGSVAERDAAYHQGTVWPWLTGAFVEAWIRVRGQTPEVCREARSRFVDPLFSHLDSAGLGHVSEIADAEPPHTPRGCPFQAWSLGELLRLTERILPQDATVGRR
jgi:predicted glycogen debranching enzyme